jgi:hypothetical protein
VAVSWLHYTAGSDLEARSTNSPEPEGEFSDDAHLINVSFAADITERLYAGFTGRLDLRVIGDVSGAGYGMDAGIYLKITDWLFAGASVINATANTWWDNRSYNEPVPQAYNLGLSCGGQDVFGVQRLDAVAALDFTFNTFGFMRVKAGGELKANDFFTVRAGFDGAVSAGLGVEFMPVETVKLRVDYAMVFDRMSDAALNHRIGLTADFAGAGARQKEQEENKAAEENNENPW